MFQTDNIYGGQWTDPYPLYNKNTIHDGDWVYKASDGNFYLALADGSEKQTAPGQMRIRASGIQGGEGRVIYGGLMEIDIDIEEGGTVYLSDSEAGKVTEEHTGRALGISLGGGQFLITAASSGESTPPDEKTIQTKNGVLVAASAAVGINPQAGIVLPDGVTISINSDGKLFAVVPEPEPYVLEPATEDTLGGVMVDGSTISVTDEGKISATGGNWTNVNLSSQCDGSRMNFSGTFPHPEFTRVFLNGLKLCNGVNYTISETTLSLTTVAPKVGSVLELEVY
jgi:flagellar basal body rod protein FlgF